jgi:cytoskeleton-associated protein 5
LPFWLCFLFFQLSCGCASLPLCRAGGSAEHTVELSAIFARIGERSTSKAGIQDLHSFSRRHPQVDISPFLAGKSEELRRYITKSVERVAEEERAAAALPQSSSSAAAPAVSAGTVLSFQQKLRDLQSRVGLAAGDGSSAAAVESNAAPADTHQASQPLGLRVSLEHTSSNIVPPIDAQPVKQAPIAGPSSSVLSLQERLNRLKASQQL